MEEILTKISWDTINEYLEKGLLIMQKHPTKNLWILNYSRQCTWDDAWDLITLSCRGLVVNENGDIVARCLKKFFNYEQLLNANYPIPNEPFTMTDKMDGQYGNLFFYDGEWILTSRGSFESMYAKRGYELLQKYDYIKLSTENTYIFEIIFKEGRIVCKYDYEDLVMLASINIETGIEKSIYGCGYEDLRFKLVKKYDGVNDFKAIKAMISNDAEGYVIQFKSGFRMKIKGDEYCRLHSIVTNISSRDIWRALKDGLPMDSILENVPDEFDKWVKHQIKMFHEMYVITESVILLKYYNDVNPTDGMSRKDVAMKVLDQERSLQGIFFTIYDGKDYSQSIWKKLYPEYTKPFNNNDDENIE
jgi:RNA ligase